MGNGRQRELAMRVEALIEAAGQAASLLPDGDRTSHVLTLLDLAGEYAVRLSRDLADADDGEPSPVVKAA